MSTLAQYCLQYNINSGLDGNAPFVDTVNRMDTFLVGLGYVRRAPDTVNEM